MIKIITGFITEYFILNFSIYIKLFAYHILIYSKSDKGLIEMEVKYSNITRKLLPNFRNFHDKALLKA